MKFVTNYSIRSVDFENAVHSHSRIRLRVLCFSFETDFTELSEFTQEIIGFLVFRPIFLPDPKDGSLYMLNSENQSDLKKLQFTIQQLVSSSPCRSTDGIFYTGLFAQKVRNYYSKFFSKSKLGIF